MSEIHRTRPWWRRLLGALAPAPLDGAEQLALHYAAEVRLADALARETEGLDRYPEPRRRILEMAERANGRAQRIRRALEEAGRATTAPPPGNGSAPMGWAGLRGSVSDLTGMSEAYLADAYATERRHPGFAELLRSLHREAAEDRQDLIWTLAHLTRTTVTTASLEGVAA